MAASSQPVLVPQNNDTRDAIGGDRVALTHFPFRVGRESRFGVVRGHLVSMERRQSQSPPNNDLYIRDQHEILHVSREHVQIEQGPDGTYELLDRNSTCGTIVDGTPIGNQSRNVRCPLRDGSVIQFGTAASPYVFRFMLQAG